MVAVLQVGVIVVGAFGPLEAPATRPDGTIGKRRKRQSIQGVITEGIDQQRWRVRFDNGTQRICFSNQLRFVRDPRYDCMSIPTQQQGEVSEVHPTAIMHSNLDNNNLHTTNNLIQSQEQQPIGEEFGTTQLQSDAEQAYTGVQQEEPFACTLNEDGGEDDTLNIDIEMEEEDPVEGLHNGMMGTAGIDAGSEIEGLDLPFDAMDEDAHAEAQVRAALEKESLLTDGYCVRKVCNSTNRSVTWRVVAESVPDESISEYSTIGVRAFDFKEFSRLKNKLKSVSDQQAITKKRNGAVSPATTKKNKPIPAVPTTTLTPFFDLFLKLWPGNWREQLRNLNNQIMKRNESNRRNQKNKKPILPVSEHEFFVFLGILIAAIPTGKTGEELFETPRKRYNDVVRKISESIDYSMYMKLRRFSDLRSTFHVAFLDSSKSNKALPTYNPYHPIIKLINGFNVNRKNNVAASVGKVVDETMSAFRPRTSSTGGLPNISLIQRSKKSSWKCMKCNIHVCEDGQGGRRCYSQHIVQKHPDAGLLLPDE